MAKAGRGISLLALTRVLEAHGYVLGEVRGSHRFFVHGDRKKPSIVVPSAGERVSAAHLQAIRRILDESAIVSATEFESALRKAG